MDVKIGLKRLHFSFIKLFVKLFAKADFDKLPRNFQFIFQALANESLIQ